MNLEPIIQESLTTRALTFHVDPSQAHLVAVWLFSPTLPADLGSAVTAGAIDKT